LLGLFLAGLHILLVLFHSEASIGAALLPDEVQNSLQDEQDGEDDEDNLTVDVLLNDQLVILVEIRVLVYLNEEVNVPLFEVGLNLPLVVLPVPHSYVFADISPVEGEPSCGSGRHRETKRAPGVVGFLKVDRSGV